MNELMPSPSQPPCRILHGLLNLWDMLHYFYGHHFLALATVVERLSSLVETPPEKWNAMLGDPPGNRTGAALISFLNLLKEDCERSGLIHSADLVDSALADVPETRRELRMLFDSIRREMSRHTFLRIGADEAKHYENEEILNGPIADKFPGAAIELYRAGNSYACGLPEGAVFYAMRAAEIGIRVLANHLEVEFPHGDLRLEQWHTILEQIESKIKELKKRPKSTKKSDDQAFYSQCAAQFRYFKDGFRIRSVHVYDDLSEKKALAILNHAIEFFEYLSERLSEEAS